MEIGCLGDIVFSVSDSMVQTLRDATLKGSAQTATHKRHLGKSLLEFVGVDAAAFDFKFEVSRLLGADPLAAIDQIREYEETGTTLPLVIGTQKYGEYRWLITKHSVALKHYDKQGNLVGADISVSLTEYLKE